MFDTDNLNKSVQFQLEYNDSMGEYLYLHKK